MARHDYLCGDCPRVIFDVDVPIAIGATAGAPLCPACGARTVWIPAVGRMDAAGGASFKAFDAYDGANRPVHIDSVHKLRQVERESEQLARNGEGQQVNWRMWSNDKSNRLDNTLGKYHGGEQPDPAFAKKFGKAMGKAAADQEFGPGVNESNTSALGGVDRVDGADGVDGVDGIEGQE